MVLLNDTLEQEASQPIFPRWPAPGALAATPEGEFTHSKQWLQGFCPQKRRREPRHRSLNPPHKALLLRSFPEFRPRGALRTHRDNIQTVLSTAANLTPRHRSA